MDGKLIGGWEFVWAAYGIAWMALAVYAAFAVRHERASRSGDHR